MKLLLITAGSRGDVEPFVALARAAARAGHTVRLAAPDDSGAAAEGVDLVSLGVDFTAMIREQGVSVGAALRSYRTTVLPTMRGVIVGAARAALAFRPDIVVAHPKILSAPLIASALDVRHVLVEMVPAVTPTRAFPAAGTIRVSVGPLNRVTYRAASGAARMFSGALDEAASVLGSPRRERPIPPAATVLPLSPALLERPGDWPDDVHLTGPWVDSTIEKEVPDDVAAFVDTGPFVYAGFGSMAAGDPVGRGRALIEAARSRHRRLLLVTGLGGVEVPPQLRGDDLLVVPSVPHELVLPRATAAVHHGGIGTLQAAMRAGTPSIIVPFIADQPFWGAMMHRRGLAPAPIPRRRVSAARLGAALDAAPGYRARVEEVSERMKKERGTEDALAVITALR